MPSFPVWPLQVQAEVSTIFVQSYGSRCQDERAVPSAGKHLADRGIMRCGTSHLEPKASRPGGRSRLGWTEHVYEQTLLPQMNWGFPGRYDMWTFRDMINFPPFDPLLKSLALHFLYSTQAHPLRLDSAINGTSDYEFGMP
jgi:hypothetical protein